MENWRKTNCKGCPHLRMVEAGIYDVAICGLLDKPLRFTWTIKRPTNCPLIQPDKTEKVGE